MAGKRMIKTAVAAMLALAVVGAVSVRPVPAKATTLGELQQKQAQLQQKSKSLDSQLQQLKNNKAQQQQYKDALDAKIDNLAQQIGAKSDQINQLDADILAKQNQIAAKQKDIDADFQKLKERVYALYLTGEASDLEIILNAKNIMDLADKAELLQVISKHDTDLMNALKDDMNSIAQQKTEIEKSRKVVSDAKTSLEQNEQQIQQLSNESASVIASLNKSQKNIEATKAATEQDEQEASNAVDQWFANYYSSNSGGQSIPASSGGFRWPIPGYIEVSQGYKGSAHKGIDIAARAGTPIYAAASGRVIFAGFGNGSNGYNRYGYVVVIDHGNGYSTLYAHMLYVSVGTGQTVSQGQKIGAVGSTGDSTGNHCHFEVRSYGQYQNPFSFVSQP